MKSLILTTVAAMSLACGAILVSGCQEPDSAPADAAARYNNTPGVPDKSAGAPNSVQHVGSESHSGVLGGGSANDPNAATPGGG